MTWWNTDEVFCISFKCQDLCVANNFESFRSAPMSSSHRFSKIFLLKIIVPLLTVTLYFLTLIYCFYRTYPLSRSCFLLVSLLQCNMYEDRDHIWLSSFIYHFWHMCCKCLLDKLISQPKTRKCTWSNKDILFFKCIFRESVSVILKDWRESSKAEPDGSATTHRLLLPP